MMTRGKLGGGMTSLLGVTANSILLTPYPPQPGTDMALSVRLFNSERVPANKVKVDIDYQQGDWMARDKSGSSRWEADSPRPPPLVVCR